MSPRIQLAIFDIAGTLIEDHDEVTDSFLTALRNHKLEVSETEIKEWKGSSKREVIGHFVARQHGSCRIGPLLEQIYSEFRFLLEKRYANSGVIPIEGAAKTLAWLREQSIKIATTTGFYREVRDLILNAASWQDAFDVNVCSDDVAHGRPAPDMIYRVMQQTSTNDPNAVVNIGDTPLDLQSAASASVRFSVGVLTGKHPVERLSREPHAHIIDSVAELPKMVESLLPTGSPG